METHEHAIASMKNSNGEWVHSTEDILNISKDYFVHLFHSQNGALREEVRQLIRDSGIPKLSDDHISILNKPFTRFEIECALFKMDGHKAPEPDASLQFFINSTVMLWVNLSLKW